MILKYMKRCPFIIALAFAALACSDDEPKTGSETHWLDCQKTSDCPAGSVCIFGKCRTEDAGIIVGDGGSISDLGPDADAIRDAATCSADANFTCCGGPPYFYYDPICAGGQWTCPEDTTEGTNCEGPPDGGCTRGSEGCECYESALCDPGLTCDGGICNRVPDAGGDSGTLNPTSCPPPAQVSPGTPCLDVITWIRTTDRCCVYDQDCDVPSGYPTYGTEQACVAEIDDISASDDQLTFFSLPINSARAAVSTYDAGRDLCVSIIWDYSNTGHALDAYCAQDFGTMFPYVYVERGAAGAGCWDYTGNTRVLSSSGCIDFADFGSTHQDAADDIEVVVSGSDFSGTVKFDNVPGTP